MWSPNKARMTTREREHVDRIKNMSCVICDAPPPSEAHEIEQGLWFASLPLCPSCHRSDQNGLHGRRAIWKVKKMDELKALALTIERLTGE